MVLTQRMNDNRRKAIWEGKECGYRLVQQPQVSQAVKDALPDFIWRSLEVLSQDGEVAQGEDLCKNLF